MRRNLVGKRMSVSTRTPVSLVESDLNERSRFGASVDIYTSPKCLHIFKINDVKMSKLMSDSIIINKLTRLYQSTKYNNKIYGYVVVLCTLI